MDKVIIDGVDVSGCNNIDEWEHCNICQVLIKTVPNRHQCLTEGDLRCEFYPDCYYKQLKRLEQENEELKQENEQLKKSIDRIMQNKEIKTIDLDIAKENAELKAENEKLKTDIAIYKGIIDSDKEENERLKKLKFKSDGIELLQDANLNLHNANVKYRQALQEIRGIAEKMYNTNDEDVERDFYIKLQDKVNEVIGAE